MKSLVLSATILFSASQAHAGPFDGTYLPNGERDNGATCQSLDGIFDGRTPYRIEEGWIEYMESGCKLSELSTLMDGSVRYQASCASEGNEYSEIIEITPFVDGSGIRLKGGSWREVWSLCTVPPVEARRNPMFEFFSRYAERLIELRQSIWTIQDFADEMKSLDLMGDEEALNYVSKFSRIIDRIETDELDNPRLVECLDREAVDLARLDEQVQSTAQAILDTGYPGAVINQDQLNTVYNENQENFLQVTILGQNAVILCLAKVELKAE